MNVLARIKIKRHIVKLSKRNKELILMKRMCDLNVANERLRLELNRYTAALEEQLVEKYKLAHPEEMILGGQRWASGSGRGDPLHL